MNNNTLLLINKNLTIITKRIINEIEDEQICGDGETYTFTRFLYIFLSSWIAFIGVIGNIILFYLFVIRKYPNTPPTLYPSVLSILDGLICLMYILLFGSDSVIVYLHLKELYIIYHLYIVPSFVISRITQLAIPYMLIFATLERFVWIVGNMKNRILKTMYSRRGRMITMITTLSICIFLRLPTYWAVTVYEYPNCHDFFRTKTASASEWVMESLIYHVYDFHLLSIAQTVLPFIILLTFNIIIVKKLYSMKNDIIDHSSLTPLKSESSMYGIMTYNNGQSVLLSDNSSHILPLKNKMNSEVKSAIYTMVAIVTSYLLSNTLHLILTGLERSNSDLLRHPEDPNLASTFHTTFSDIVSFVYMFTSAIRIIIYYICNQSIRNDINSFIKDHLFNKNNHLKIVIDTQV